MKIYVCHSTGFDYESELYAPLRNTFGNKHELVLPHDSNEGEHSKTIIQSCDIVLSEVSFPSTGLGIELGWADDLNIPIICIHKPSARPSSALSHITQEVVCYDDENDMLNKLASILT